jgi:uncharacterized hydrophobic protein (TIGR00271 family)
MSERFDPARELRLVAARLRRLAGPIQDRLAMAIGVVPSERDAAVVLMLASNVRRNPGYWIQLFIATGIATLGLALDSTAVVIGAMLVSPLMGPLVELGMGFAVGSSLLVLRAALCVALSVAGVVLLSAFMTVTLPFHEMTAEIAARTSPTLLDLLLAVFCALMATYTTIRQAADTTAAAAGTAIGIALVPPLCVTGFGLGTINPGVAGGAFLLFVANFSAIVVLAVVVFFLLGYARVDAIAIERGFHESGGGRTTLIAERAHAALRRVFGSQYGLVMRLMVPAVFLLVVFVPLSRALDDVVRQVRVREEVRRVLSAESPQAVQTEFAVDRESVVLRLLLVGTVEDASRLERTLEARIVEVSGVTPAVSVTAMPDARTLTAQVSASTRAPAAAARLDIGPMRRRVSDAITGAWPRAAGALVGWSFEVAEGPLPVLHVRHVGEPLGASGEELLARRVSEVLGSAVAIADVTLPDRPLAADAGSVQTAWLPATLQLLDDLSRMPGLRACVAGPIDARGRPGQDARAIAGLLQATRAGRGGRVEVAAERTWSVRFAQACEPASEPDRGE